MPALSCSSLSDVQTEFRPVRGCLSTLGFPELLSSYAARATFHENFDTPSLRDHVCFFAVTRRGEPWPFLVITQQYEPAGGGFYPGALVIPETHRLFLGAGRRLLAYDLSLPARLWEDEAEFGFFSWSHYGDFVLMSAEIELAVWTSSGQKLWSRFADPPWEYQIEGSLVVKTDCQGVERLDIRTGRLV